MSDEPAPTPQNETESRISALVAQREQERQKNAGLASENSALANQLAALKEQVSRLSSPPSNPPKESNHDYDRPVDKSSGNQDIASIVRSEIEKAVQPINEWRETQSKQAELQTAHQMSFEQARKLYPQLSDTEHPLTQTADRLYREMPDIANLPNGPMLVAALARGVIADDAKTSKEAGARKEHARAERPAPVRDYLRDNSEPASKEEARQVTESVLNSPESANPGSYAALFRAKLTQEANSDG